MPAPPRRILLGDIQRAVANHAIKPGDGVFWRRALTHQLEESILDNVLRFIAPLPRIQHKRGGLCIDQPCKILWAHFSNKTTRMPKHSTENYRPWLFAFAPIDKVFPALPGFAQTGAPGKLFIYSESRLLWLGDIVQNHLLSMLALLQHLISYLLEG